MTVQRDPLAHDAEQHEDVGDHHRGEELEEVLDPQVDDPEAPEVGDGEVVAGAGEQPDGVERRDRAARRGRTATACCPRARRRSRPRSPRQSMNDPEEQPDRRAAPARAGRGRGTRSPAGRTSSRRRPRARRGCRGTRRSGAERRRPRARRAARRRACPGARGSRPAIIGARKMPAATNEVATQKIASWTCQVRIRL